MTIKNMPVDHCQKHVACKDCPVARKCKELLESGKPVAEIEAILIEELSNEQHELLPV